MVEEKIPARIPALAEVQTKVERAYRDERAKALTQQAANEFIERVRAGQSMEAVASAEGRELRTSQPFLRSEPFIKPMGGSRQMRDAAFALGPDASLLDQAFAIGGDFFVASVSQRETPSVADLGEQLAELRDRMTLSRREEVFQRYVDELRARAEVRIYPDRIDALRRPS